MSSYYSYDLIQFLTEQILAHLPRSYVRVNNKINCRCPICGDSRKSVSKKRGWIYLNGQCSYYCFNCGTGMSGIKFLEYISGDDYAEIRRQYAKLCFKGGISTSLSSSYQVPTDEPSLFELKTLVKPEWKNPLSDKALAYLKKRKVLDAPFFNSNRLYTCFGGKHQSDEYILIPWTLNGIDAYYQLNDFQGLHKIKYVFPKDKKKLVAGLDNIDITWPYIIVFEGFYDSLFVKNGVCVGTKAITDYQLSLIQERYPKHQIAISFDNDEAGLQSMAKLIRQNNLFKYFKWFKPTTAQKDINDFVIANGDVNTFSDAKALEGMIVDKLLMKMFLIQKGIWSAGREQWHPASNDSSKHWKARKVQ